MVIFNFYFINVRMWATFFLCLSPSCLLPTTSLTCLVISWAPSILLHFFICPLSCFPLSFFSRASVPIRPRLHLRLTPLLPCTVCRFSFIPRSSVPPLLFICLLSAASLLSLSLCLTASCFPVALPYLCAPPLNAECSFQAQRSLKGHGQRLDSGK